MSVHPKRMFRFVGPRWNPVGGKCPYDCVYCWVPILAKRYPCLRRKYSGQPRLFESELRRRFRPSDFVFAFSCIDPFALPKRLLNPCLSAMRESHARFLMLSKNPAGASDFDIPGNVTLGATIESDIDRPALSKAPCRSDRLNYMMSGESEHAQLLVIEPILDFNEGVFADKIKWIPVLDSVAVGYDNYPHQPGHNLPEPSLAKTKRLIRELRKFTKVHVKTLREPIHKAEASQK